MKAEIINDELVLLPTTFTEHYAAEIITDLINSDMIKISTDLVECKNE